MTGDDDRSLVLVLVGTDHHPFDRLVTWMDTFARDHPDVAVLVQYGRSRPPEVASGTAFLDHDDLVRQVAAADVVVCHGGPATISEARRAGHRPVVVPRDPSRGEHIDDHQVRFSAWLSERALVSRCTDESDFTSALETALRSGRQGADDPGATVDATARHFADLVADARAGRRRRPGPTVVYVAGLGRSGSTLMERLLGCDPHVVCLGEVVHLFERGLRLDERCACGAPFSACPFWTEVGQLAFGGWSGIDVDEVRGLARSVDRLRRLPVTALSRTSPGVRRDLVAYTDLFVAIYRAAAEVSGTQVVVDSSKQVSTAYALAHCADLDLRVVHLVRDPRAVAYSWAKEVQRPEAVDAERTLMPRYSSAKASRRWWTSNLLAEGLPARGVPTVRIRYADLVADPDATIRRVADGLGLPPPPALPRSDDGGVLLGPSHSVAGNPMRFVTGPVQVRADEEWAERMPAGDRRLVGALTGPLRRWYAR